MKKIKIILIIILILNFSFIIPNKMSGETIQSENILQISKENFPDEVLREILTTKDKNYDGYLSGEEIKLITYINLDKNELQDEETARDVNTKLTIEEKLKRYCEINLKGIEKLTSLKSIRLGMGYFKGYENKMHNFKLLYKMPEFTGLIMIGNNEIDNLKLYKLKNLKGVTLYSADFESIRFGKRSKIETIDINMCNIKKRLDISQLKKLKKFKAEHSVITDLKMGSKNKLLKKFYIKADLDNIKKCNIRKLDFSNMKNLKTVEIRSWKKLKSIKFKNNNKLIKVKIVACPKLNDIRIEKCKKAKRISKQIGLKKYTVIER